MKYISTRGGADPVDFVTACLSGLAPDGGLYVPEAWPQIPPARPGEPYVDLATRIFAAFAGDAMPAADLKHICETAYASFSHQGVAPLVQLSPGEWMMELHHGPTLAFKDVAMQFIGRFYDHVLGERGLQMTVMCATSGDTGGAAAAAFAGSPHVTLIILHPDGRVSPVQRRFMTSTGAANIHNFAIDGDFDSCQAIVKALFADKEFASDVALSGVNSINWARIAAQTVYYAFAQASLGPDVPLRFIVPSGNMGDVLAGYVAGRCGLLAEFDAVSAVNLNQTLADLTTRGHMRRTPAAATPSPAMDISVPSNFERLLFDLVDRDAGAVRQFYNSYAQSGEAQLPDAAFKALQALSFDAEPVDNDATLNDMRRILAETGWLICPHTAVGTAISTKMETEKPRIVLATAHAAKFPETVLDATGRDAPLPERCAALAERGEQFERVEASEVAVRSRVRALLAP
ncbi:MAG: threonine synthase [Pseudomonadota bacterium]